MSARPVAYLGIDPGVGGAVVVLDSMGEVREWHDTPTLMIATSGRTKMGMPKMRSEYDVAAMARLMAHLAQRYTIRRVTIERIAAMPARRHDLLRDRLAMTEGRGSLATVSLAESCGLWRGLCAAHGLPVERVMPATWKHRMVGSADPPTGVSRSRRSAMVKERSRARALELFPGFAGSLARKQDHGRAEAALLAEYGRRLG